MNVICIEIYKDYIKYIQRILLLNLIVLVNTFCYLHNIIKGDVCLSYESRTIEPTYIF